MIYWNLFQSKPATRGMQPLLIVLTSEAWGGKTMSALRLAVGIREVTGQRIVFADTEAPRGCAYADQFEYEYVDMSEPPFPPERFIALLNAFQDTILIIDSWSDEHEGIGGMSDIHQEVVDSDRRDVVIGKKNQAAWIVVKARRNRLVHALKKHPGIVILCVRAKPPSALGKDQWMPITGDCFLYPATACFFLRDAGHIVWGEKRVSDTLTRVVDGIPRDCLSPQLDETTGTLLAHWANGTMPVHPMSARLADANSADEIDALEKEIKVNWAHYDQWSQRQINIAGKEAWKRVTGV
jgi:hypothetical protein